MNSTVLEIPSAHDTWSLFQAGCICAVMRLCRRAIMLTEFPDIYRKKAVCTLGYHQDWLMPIWFGKIKREQEMGIVA